MIKEITELNFPKDENGKQYATLSKATVTLNDMGEKTITSQVSIDGQIKPDFSQDWEVEFKGEKYIMPLRKPQASKGNDSLSSKIDLTFQHWAIYQLKRQYFITLQSEIAGVAVADKYIASVSLNLGDFVTLYDELLKHYYGQRITIDLNPNLEFSEDPVFIDINYSYMWDVLIKIYELFGVRWEITKARSNNPSLGVDRYVIRVGYDGERLDHIFEYGYEGGLLKIERQVQDDNIRNMLLGRGGEKNLPYHYFKNNEGDNDSFPADPDWIPELANVYFDRLRSAEYRSYIQGWKYRHYFNKLANSRYVQRFDSEVPWAWEKGYADSQFQPIEFVKDDESIRKYGELMGGLEDNEDIYPTIQGVIIDPYGRIDMAVDVEQVTTDAPENPDSLSRADLVDPPISLPKAIANSFTNIKKGTTEILTLDMGTFRVPVDCYADADSYITEVIPNTHYEIGMNYGKYEEMVKDIIAALKYKGTFPYAVDSNGNEVLAQKLKPGTYTLRLKTEIENTYNHDLMVKLSCEGATIKVYKENASSLTKDRTFDIWVKNIWQSTKGASESPEEYVRRVWEPILGNHLGEEAAICFSTGNLSVSEDYEFKILGPNVNVGIHYDTSRSIYDKDAGREVFSEWRITCIRSDADYDSMGLFVPNTKRQGAKGDKFYFIGIELTQFYVDWAEQRLHNYKLDQLARVKDIMPTWVVSLDKVRVGRPQYDDVTALIDQLLIGGKIRLTDKRFIVEEGQAELDLYIQTLTYKFNEQGNTANLTPNIEIVLGDEYVTSASAVETIQGKVDAISRQLGSVSASAIEQVVRQVGDKVYLRKDGITDRSLSTTFFAEIIASLGFRQGMVGGDGWGFFRDENGKWVLETDRVNVREEMQVNNLVINQISARGGMIIESAASIEVTFVEEVGTAYRCYFDIKGGTVANLFVVNDIGYCHRWLPDNSELKYYKRRVQAVGDDYIDLSKSAFVDGTGIPSEGDVIVQYGNYSNTNKDRQFVIIRDTVGGGYERMLCDLNSVTAKGTEYYFAGYQSDTGARFFIGDPNSDNHIEYKNGKLYIPGQLILDSKLDNGQSMIDYIKSQGAKSTLDEWTKDGYISPLEKQAIKDEIARIDSDHNIILNGCQDYGLDYPTQYEDAYEAYRDMLVDLSAESPDVIKIPDDFNKVQSNYYSYRQRLLQEINLSPKNYTDDEIAGYEYLKDALANGRTEVSNGLMLTSLIQLGVWSGTQLTVYSGINGLYSTYGATGIAAWYGGDMVDKEKTPDAKRPAKALFRFDGSGYVADGLIGWRTDGSGWVAKNAITWEADGTLKLNSGLTIEGAGDGLKTLESIVNTLNTFTTNFQPVINGNGDTTTWDKVSAATPLFAVKSKVGFYSDSFISAMGLNSNTGDGGGGGITYLSGLYDTSIDKPKQGQILSYNGARWVNTDFITQEVGTATDKVPSENAVREAIANRTEGAIPLANIEQMLATLDNPRLIHSPHIYQVIRGNTNVGMLFTIGDNSTSTLNLLLMTRLALINNVFQTGSDTATKLYTNTFDISTGKIGTWAELIGNTTSEGGGSNPNYNTLRNDLDRVIEWVNMFSDDPGEWNNGTFWSQFTNLKSSYTNTDTWVTALKEWTGIPSDDPGEWGENITEQLNDLNIETWSHTKGGIYPDTVWFACKYDNEDGETNKAIISLEAVLSAINQSHYGINDLLCVWVGSVEDLQNNVLRYQQDYRSVRPLNINGRDIGTCYVLSCGNWLTLIIETQFFMGSMENQDAYFDTDDGYFDSIKKYAAIYDSKKKQWKPWKLISRTDILEGL